jgi:hypothetical protein
MPAKLRADFTADFTNIVIVGGGEVLVKSGGADVRRADGGGRPG